MTSRIFASVISISVLSTAACGTSDSGATSPGANYTDVHTTSQQVTSGSVAIPDIAMISALAFFDAKGGLRILLSDKANTCSSIRFKSSANIDIRLASKTVALNKVINPSETRLAEGQAYADYSTATDTCSNGPVSQPSVAGGVVEIRSFNVTNGVQSVQGNVTLQFPGGYVSGAYNALLCPPVVTPSSDAGMTDAGPPAPVCI